MTVYPVDSVDSDAADPFLPGDDGHQEEVKVEAGAYEPPIPTDKIRWRVIFTALALILFAEMGMFMMQAPFVRIFEDITCRQWYATNDPKKFPLGSLIPEKECKGEDIQSEAAIIRGFQELFDGLVGLACALPFGNLADKIGRKPVFLLSIPAIWLYSAFLLTVMWLEWPLRLVWPASLFFTIGGGPPVIAALVWTIVADVANEEQRSTAFMQIGVASMIAEFVAGAASGFLLSFNAWLAMFASTGILCGSMLIIFAFPETKGFASVQKQDRTSVSFELDDYGAQSAMKRESYDRSYVGRLKQKIRSLRQESGFILEDSGVWILLLTFFVYKISRGAGAFFVQYVSKRYDWTIAHANYLTSVKAFFNIFLFTSILPFASWWLAAKRGIKGNKKEFFLSKISIMLLFAGTVGIGLSPHIVVMVIFLIAQTLGSGFAFQIRAIITTMVETHQVARLYVLITILETAGNLLAGPLSAGVFKWGLELGEPWIGLPFLFTGSIFLLAALGTLS